MKVDPLKTAMVEARIKQIDMARDLEINPSTLNLFLNLVKPWRPGVRDGVAAYIAERSDV